MSKVIERLQDLVRIYSLSCAEEEIANWILSELLSVGVSAEIVDGNVVARIEGKDSSRAFIFNGHTDTVEAGSLSEWKYPPYGEGAGVIEDGNLYGLGASDMKASLAAFMVLAERYVSEKPAVDTFFAFVTEEEVSGRGSRNYIKYFEENWRGRYLDVVCVVGEPTDFKYIELGNRGVHFIELTVEGEACHASQAVGRKKIGMNGKERSSNAPELAIDAIGEMEKLRCKWIESYSHEVLGEPAVVLTGMNSSESSPNTVPSSVKLRWDIRTTPELHGVISEELAESLGGFGEIVSLRDPCPCAFCSEDSILVETFRSALPCVERRIARGGNDCGFFIEAGIPAVTFGPGLKGVIHTVNEYAPVKELESAVDVYGLLVSVYGEA